MARIIEFKHQGKKYQIYDTEKEQKAQLIIGKDKGGKNINYKKITKKPC